MNGLPSDLPTMNGLTNGKAVGHHHQPSLFQRPELQTTEPEEGNFRDILGMLRRRSWVIAGVAAAFIGYSAWSILGEENQYAGNFQILVEPVNMENANLAAPDAGLGRSRGRSSLDYPTQISVLKSPDLVNQIVERLRPTYPGLSVGAVANNLNINRIRDTKILEVSYQSNTAARTQAVLEETADVFLQYSLNERQTYLRQGLQFVDQQLNDLQGQVDELQTQLELFRQNNNLVDPDLQSNQISSRIAELEQRKIDLQQQIAGTVAQADVFLDDTGLGLALDQDAVYQQLLSQSRALDVEISQELTRFNASNPRIQVLQQQRNNLAPLLRERELEFLEKRLAEGALQAEALETQLQVVDSALGNLQGQFQLVPALSREYANIQRQLEITTASLTRFLETRQQLQVEAAQQEIPWQVVREPSIAVIASNVTNALMTRILMGIGLGIGAAFVLEKLDPTFHSAAELQRKLKLPLLGTLPFNQQLYLDQTLGSGQQRRRKLLSRMRLWLVKTSAKFSKSMSFIALSLLDEFDTSAEFVEALRVLHTNLQMLKRSRPMRCLVLTSAAPGDGKTTAAVNLAKTAASLGQRVLLIDASLRNPQLHQAFNLPNAYGLSSILSHGLHPKRALQQVSPDEALYVITAGPAHPDPATLLASPRLTPMMAACKRAFDLVIVDTPAVLGLADAMLMAQHGDGTILVARLGQTHGHLVKQATEQIQSLEGTLLGLVANGEKGHNLPLRQTVSEGVDTEDTWPEPPSQATLPPQTVLHR